MSCRHPISKPTRMVILSSPCSARAPTQFPSLSSATQFPSLSSATLSLAAPEMNASQVSRPSVVSHFPCPLPHTVLGGKNVKMIIELLSEPTQQQIMDILCQLTIQYSLHPKLYTPRPRRPVPATSFHLLLHPSICFCILPARRTRRAPLPSLDLRSSGAAVARSNLMPS